MHRSRNVNGIKNKNIKNSSPFHGEKPLVKKKINGKKNKIKFLKTITNIIVGT